MKVSSFVENDNERESLLQQKQAHLLILRYLVVSRIPEHDILNAV